MLWVAYFDTSAKGWSVYDPSDTFSPEMLWDVPGLPDDSEIGELTVLHYRAVYLLSIREPQDLQGLGYRDRSLSAGVNLIVW